MQVEFYLIQYRQFYEQFHSLESFYVEALLFRPQSCYRQFLEHLGNSLGFIRYCIRILRNGLYYVTC